MTRDDIIRMAREAQMPYYYRTGEVTNLEQLERFAALIAAAEREACAWVCDELVLAHPGRADLTADQCAAAIRTRGETK